MESQLARTRQPSSVEQSEASRVATWRDYVRLARPDHWVKHVFIVPGIVLALLLRGEEGGGVELAILLGFASAALMASANYVLNEWLDAGTDRYHPSKSMRPAVDRRLSAAVVWSEYGLLFAGAVLLASFVSGLFLMTLCLFGVSAWIYNIPPLRSKDRPVLDVVTEAVNNPLRLTLGWSMIASLSLPPSSLLLGYWMTGAFLMGVKRLAEYRTLEATVGLANAALYRRSFGWYSERRLLVTLFLYAQLAAFFLAVFLVKYRIEYLLALPAVAAWFASYLRVGLKPESVAQTPERLLKERSLMAVTVLLIVALAVLTWLDLPFLERLTDPHYIELGWFSAR